jgi:hypothetical protein
LEGSWRIILWWELRRFWYNLIVGPIAIASWFVIGSIFLTNPKNNASSVTGGLMFGCLISAIVANVCYTGGWIVELLTRKIWRERAIYFGEISFALGLVFSILLTVFPALILLFLYCLRLRSESK